ncbi:MAG: PHB depolymerase family esterase [Rhodoferax sp.]|nr:PHB depolymerase family esterase [Rhodoferax sp.]
MNKTMQERMREATRLTQAGQLFEATATLQQALGASAPPSVADRPAQISAVGLLTRVWPGKTNSASSAPGTTVLDDFVIETPDAQIPVALEATIIADEFISVTHTHAALTRQYKLYVPPEHAGKNLPLVVMLHGCTQDPDDFAAGTRMNAFARDQGFFVLYPAQAQEANASRCWNWFKHTHQRRGSGEPALLADMTQSVIRQYRIDRQRVYIAGLSAGGAMAAIVANLYPEIFVAAGIHSGLASGAAGNLPEALSAMKNGARAVHAAAADAPVRTIVFHGDRDSTVHTRNGEQAFTSALGRETGTPRVEQGATRSGRRYTRTVQSRADGTVLAEHWVVHGAGHAWFGGSADGSYTDASGPDATAEMLRFFFARP